MITALDGVASWQRFEQLLELVEASGNLLHCSPFFQFHLIHEDPDDNAFTDCAITVHADYVITSDKHFAPLAEAGYKPQPITPEAFLERYGQER